MSEGGYFPWKRQTIQGTPGDYSNLSRPLPTLPKGHSWARNPETREWSVVLDEDNDFSNQDTLRGGELQASDEVDLNNRKLPEGCDYLQHQVQKSDTFQGICLKYGITPTSLRQTNKFSGSNLLFAPELLIIPLVKKLSKGSSGGGANSTLSSTPQKMKETQINQFLVTFRQHRASNLVSRKEAQAYLDMNDGNLEMAIRDAKADFGWELGEDEKTSLLE